MQWSDAYSSGQIQNENTIIEHVPNKGGSYRTGDSVSFRGVKYIAFADKDNIGYMTIVPQKMVEEYNNRLLSDVIDIMTETIAESDTIDKYLREFKIKD